MGLSFDSPSAKITRRSAAWPLLPKRCSAAGWLCRAGEICSSSAPAEVVIDWQQAGPERHIVAGRTLGLCLRIRRSVFIRSLSATPVVACALNPQNESSSSSLTSPNVSVLTSPQLHTRKVAGSIPAGTTQNLPKSQAMLRRSTVGHRFRHGKDFASSTSPSAHFRARSSASTTG